MGSESTEKCPELCADTSGGNHWLVVANIGCSSDTVKVLDSLATGEPSTQLKN